MPVHNFYEDELRKNNRNPGLLLVAGELVDEATEHVITCGLQDYDKYMGSVYPDWAAFKAWLDERYWLCMGYKGGVPAKWWELPSQVQQGDHHHT